MIVAVQVSPEYQEAPLLVCANAIEYFGDFKLFGNDRIREFTSNDRTNDVAGFVERILDGGYTAEDIAEDSTFLKYHGEMTAEQAERFGNFLDGKIDPGADDRGWLANFLTGEEWHTTTLCGCCQCEWIDCLYHDMSRDDLWILETEFFNTGEEYDLYELPDGAALPKDADELKEYAVQNCSENYGIYVHDTCNPEEEIAEYSATPGSDIVLLKCSGYTTTPKYEIA